MLSRELFLFGPLLDRAGLSPRRVPLRSPGATVGAGKNRSGRRGRRASPSPQGEGWSGAHDRLLAGPGPAFPGRPFPRPKRPRGGHLFLLAALGLSSPQPSTLALPGATTFCLPAPSPGPGSDSCKVLLALARASWGRRGSRFPERARSISIPQPLVGSARKMMFFRPFICQHSVSYRLL